MRTDAEKEKIRILIDRAAKMPDLDLKVISKAAGVSYGSVRSFVSTGKLGNDRLHLLRLWLQKNSDRLEYIGENDAIPGAIPPPKPTLLSGLAQELRGLATILESDGLDDAAKLGAFRDRILGYAKTFDKFGIGSK